MGAAAPVTRTVKHKGDCLLPDSPLTVPIPDAEDNTLRSTRPLRTELPSQYIPVHHSLHSRPTPEPDTVFSAVLICRKTRRSFIH